MEKYKVEIKKSVVKEIKRLQTPDLQNVLAKIAALAENPRPFDSIKLSGDDKYRVRCGNYRILYTIEDDKLIVYVVKVGHRRDVYR